MLVGIACWGFTPVILRHLTGYIDAYTANGVRYAMSAILYWPLLVWGWRTRRLQTGLIKRCVVPALFALGGQVFWALAHYELQASEVGFLVRLSTFWSVVGSIILFHDERQLLKRPGFYLGTGLIVVGFLTMTLLARTVGADVETGAAATMRGNFQLGVIYIVLCGIFFGAYVVSVRCYIPDADPLLAFGVVSNVVSVGTLIGMIALGDPASLLKQTAWSWSLLAASSFLGIALGHVMMYVAVQRIGAAITASCQTMMPFVTAIAASFTLGEILSGQQWTGGIVMVTGATILLSIKNVVGKDPKSQSSSDK